MSNLEQAYKDINDVIMKHKLSAREILSIANDMSINATIALTLATMSDFNNSK